MKRRFFLLAVGLAVALTSTAQVIAYNAVKSTAATETVIDLQGTTGTDLSKTLFDNDGNINTTAAEDVTGFPIGFPFAYNGQDMQYFVLTGDGVVVLSATEAITTSIHTQFTANNQLITDGTTNAFGVLMRLGYYGLDDTQLSYKTEGPEGDRVLTITYKNVGVRANGDLDDVGYTIDRIYTAKAQVQYRLYERSGNIEMTLNGFKPETQTGLFNYMRIGIVGDSRDWQFLKDYDATAVATNEASITYSADSYPEDGTTYTFVAPEPCQAPAAGADALTLASTTKGISGVFTAGTADHYLVLITRDQALTEQPANRTKYAVGDVLGNATVAAIVTEGAFSTPENLEAGREYTVFVYAYNSLCTAGPVFSQDVASASIATKPEAPEAVTFADIDKTTLTVDVKSAAPVLVAITSEQGVDRWGDPAPYGAFGEPTGTYNVGNEIEGGGRVILAGAATSIQLSGLEEGTTYYVRAWSSDGAGNYSTEYIDAAAVTADVVPWLLEIDETVGYELNMPGWTFNDRDQWVSNPSNKYFYANIPYIEDEEAGAEAWAESPYIYLSEGTNYLYTALGGTQGGGWFSSDWTLADGDKVAFQLTTDGETYEDILTITSEDFETLSRSALSPISTAFEKYAGQKVRLRVYVLRHVAGQTRIGSILLSDEELEEFSYTLPYELVVNEAEDEDLEDWSTYQGVLSDDTDLQEGGEVRIAKSFMTRKYMITFWPNEAVANSWLVSPLFELDEEATATTQYDATLTLTTQYKGTSFLLQVVVADENGTFTPAGVVGTITNDDLPEEGEQKDFTFTFAGPTSNLRLGYYITGEGEDAISYINFDRLGLREHEADAVNGPATTLPSANAPAYNLQGMRVTHPTHGIHVVGGRKVAVK